MNYFRILLVVLSASAGLSDGAKECGQNNKKLSTSKLVCYYSALEEIDGCYCTHVILPANSDVKGIEKVKERAKGLKIYVSVNEFNQGLINLLKTSKVDGLELNLNKLDSKNDISDFISTVKTKLGSDLDIALSVPFKADLLAKYFDFKVLSKHADLFILQTAFLGASTNVTFHPSRLSGMWDMQNTDSVVDLVSGLGAPLSKLVITAPVQAYQFTLQNQAYTAPGSPALELKSITRNELCKMMRNSKNWTIERDEDQAGPYIFNKNQWIAFEDSKSMDIKAKYSRVRGLAGMALKDLSQDGDGSECGSISILEAAYNGLSRQSRAPRGAVLHSLEREIVGDSSTKPLDSVQLSPYRISRIIDTEGKIHVVRQRGIRKNIVHYTSRNAFPVLARLSCSRRKCLVSGLDSRTEFQCSRQGYFVHPRSCNRFYRCVKFNQLSEDYNVFEFDCPAGLAFDERVEVCVWPGSLPHGTPCSGSSEIAPVPKERFVCPSEPGYYADPENCRWFFACLDHGKSPLSAYEFRCPFGLVFDSDRLVCEWSWLVPKCASGLGVGLDSEYYYGGLGDGYAVKGSQSAGLLLQNYNGLGALGTVKLGGISGKIEQPIATVYSNVGTGNLGLGYQNTGGYIEGGGLSYKAANALQNAGLLKVNNGVGYQATAGQNYQGTLYANVGQSDYSQHTGANAGTLLVNADGYAATGANIHLAQDNSIENGYHDSGAQGAVSSQSFTQFQVGAGDSGQYQGAHTSSVSGDGGFEYNIQGQSGEYEASKQGYAGVQGGNSGYLINGANLQSDNAAGALSSQTFTQYHGGQEESKNAQQIGAGVAGSINIIGGGYSAVGSLSGIDVSNNGEGAVSVTSSPAIVSVTSAPSVSKLASVPTVTAVPVPGIKTAAGFETIRGGVIANIPELQYKVGSLEDAGLFSNISNSFANFVVTSPATDQKQFIQQAYSKAGGYIYNKPLNAFEAGVLNTVSISTARPFVAVTTEQPQVYVSSTVKPLTNTVTIQENPADYSTHNQASVVQPAVSSITYQKYDTNGGYKYEKPLVRFEEKPQAFVVSTPSPAVVVEQQPQIVVSSTPASYSYNKHEGYVYNKPSIAFEENPGNPTIISKFTIRKPIDVQQPTVVNEIPSVQLKQKTKVEDYSYQQPAIVSQYYYQQPTIKKQPIIPLYQQPELLSTYTYQPPLQKQPVTRYTYQNVAQQALGVTYQKPAQTYAYQPSGGGGTSYQYINLENKQQEKSADVHSQGGYVYSKPSITFEEKPQVAVVGSYQYSTPKPSVVVQETEQQSGYVYEKPSVTFEETPVTYSTPKPVVAVQQPAVVSNYFNTGTSNVKAENGGYSYPRPAVHFEETPVVYSTPKPVAVQPAVVTSYFNIDSSKTKAETSQQQAQVDLHFQETPVVYSTPKTAVAPTQSAVVTSYFNFAGSKANDQSSQEQAQVNLHFQENPVIYSTPKSVVVPAQSASYFNFAGSKSNAPSSQEQAQADFHFQQTPVIYSTPKPVVVPAQPASYFNFAGSKANAESSQQQAQVDLHFQETPVVYSTPKPIVLQAPSKQAVATSYFNYDGSKEGAANSQGQVYIDSAPVFYSTSKPTTNPAVVTSYFNFASSKANAENSQEHVYATPKPIAVQPVVSIEAPAQPAVVTSYFNFDSAKTNAESSHQQAQVDLHFKQTPVVYSTPKPIAVVQPVGPIETPAQPALVSSYFNFASAKANAESSQQQEQADVQFQETPVVYSTPKPASYFNLASSKANADTTVEQENVAYSYPKPSVQFEKRPQTYSTTPQPVQPAVVSSYFTIGSSKANVVEQQNIGYDYPKPAIAFEEIPVTYSTPKPVQPVFTNYANIDSSSPRPKIPYTYQQEEVEQPQLLVEATPKPATVTSYFHQQPSKGYDYPKPSIKFQEGAHQPVEEVPFIKKTAYVTGQYQGNSQENYGYQHTGKVVVENYEFPEYEKVKQAVFGEKLYQPQVLNYIQSTPKPTFISTISTTANKFQPATVTTYDSRYSSTHESYPEVHLVSTTSRPISKFAFSSLDDQYRYKDIVKSTTVEPVRSYLPGTSTVRITSALPKISKVVEEFVAPEVTTLAREYLPAPDKEYLPVRVRTKAPIKRVKVVTSTTSAPEITTLNREYLPVRSRVKVTSTEEPTYTIRSRRPSTIKVIKPVTVIKQNDAHPLLSAKLGAQCTCVSNTLRLRKKQKIIIVEDDESEDDDDGYVVDDENQGKVVESYNYEPQKVVDITPIPEVYLPSSTVEPQLYVKKRVRVRPLSKQTYSPVTEVSEIFYRKNITPIQGGDDDSNSSDKEIVKAVRTGLKLVKQAAKEGAKEGTAELLANNQFDRYGPGGVRSREERLQGTIDCQRAGLFRHPTECNKFYACRWDCTKNRFTLHVFNCPVQLTFDNTLGACNWPSQGPACVENTLITSD